MTTDAKIDLAVIRERLRRAKATEEPFDAADQWAVLGYHVPELVDEIVRLRRLVLAVADACHELSERPIGHEVPERLAFAAGPYRIAESLREALGSTPDLGDPS